MRAALIAALIATCFTSLHAQDQTGTIIFYREPHFTGSNASPPALFCDGVEIARIPNGSYFGVVAPPGIHRCSVESLQHPFIEVNVAAGQAAYVHLKMLPGIRDHFVLTNTTEDEYTKQNAKLKPVKEWSRAALGTTPAPEIVNDSSQAPSVATVEPAELPGAADNTGPTVTPDRDVEARPQHELRVFLTNRKSWLASGGFTPSPRTRGSTAPDFTKDFHKRCSKLVITEMQDTANYAVTIDEITTLDALTGPANQPTFKVAVYSRDAGLLYSGGTQFIKNAVKDACDAIGAK